MEKHIKVARAHRAITWLYGLLIAIYLLLFLYPSEDRIITDGMMYAFFLFVGMFILHYFIAKGAREMNPVARGASLAIASVLLFAFPFGTVIGIYLIVNAWKPWDMNVSGGGVPSGNT